MTTTAVQIAEKLTRTGLCIWPNYLSPQLLYDLHQDFNLLRDASEFSRAGVGQGDQRTIRDLIRRDEVCWLNRDKATAVQSCLWNQLDLLKTTLNQSHFLAAQNFEGHYAFYPEGGFYKRHLDSSLRNNNRLVSLILYLNPDWKPGDGGCLRVYTADSYTDIQPIGGTLVCFASQELEHEVLSSNCPRLSFTGWFKS
ncbi:MAG: 2OG-Fe(II) oxygenase [Bdellovibrionota bacterium]